MEEAEKELLETLTSMGPIKSHKNIDTLQLKILNYTRYFTTVKTEDLLNKSKVKINEFNYGKIIAKLFETFDNNWPIQNENINSNVEDLLIINNSSFEIMHELLTVSIDFIKKSSNSSAINSLMIILEKVIKSESLYSVILDICMRNEESEIVRQGLYEDWMNFNQLLVSLPSRIANKTEGKMNKVFMPDYYSKILSYHLARSMLFLNENKYKFEVDCNVKMIGMMMSKIFMILGANKFVELIEIMINWSLDNGNNMKSFIQMILLSLEKSSVEHVAVMLLKMIKKPDQVLKIIGNLLDNEQWLYVLTVKIPLLSYYDNDTLIFNLVSYLCTESFDERLLVDLLVKLLDVWGDRSALNHTSLEQHEYITKLIILIVKKLKGKLKPIDRDTVQKLLFSGTEAHLENMKVDVRGIGMITGELIIGLLTESSDAPKLNYEYENMPIVGKKMVDKIKDFYNNENFQTGSGVEGNLGDEKIGKRDFIKELGIKSLILSEENVENVGGNVSNKSSKIIVDEKKNKNRQVEEDNVDDDDDLSELDSDDDLVPYDMSNDTKVSDKLRPVYLRDLKEILINHNENSDPEKFTEALECADDLISSQLPHDDLSLALELLEIISTLTEISFVKNFTDLKFKSCVTIVTIYPKECAEYLCLEFHAKIGTHSVATRIFYLQILAEAAKRLSSVKTLKHQEKIGNKKEKKIAKYKKPSKPFSVYLDMTPGKITETLYDEDLEVLDITDESSSNWQEIVQERIKNNTKIIAHKTKIPESTMNKFNDAASHFFYPLLYGLMKKEACMYKIPKTFEDHDTILLVEFIKTLSTLMVAAENCVIAPKIGLEILELAWTLRYHQQAKVRLCVIESIAAVIVSISGDNYNNEIVELLLEFRMWLLDVSHNSVMGDPDANCRKLGKSVVELIDSVISSTVYAK